MSENCQGLKSFKARVSNLLRSRPDICRTIHVPKRQRVYTSGQRDAMMYLVEEGQIKLLLPSAEGKECLIDVHVPGDIFGELCLSGQTAHQETAVAMQDSILTRISPRSFLSLLQRESLLDGLIQHLIGRIAEQEETITRLLTVNSEKRLAATLVRLGRKLGTKQSTRVRIDQRFSHEELSEMVGTTRPRICTFMKRFQELGFVETTTDRGLIINEEALKVYS